MFLQNKGNQLCSSFSQPKRQLLLTHITCHTEKETKCWFTWAVDAPAGLVVLLGDEDQPLCLPHRIPKPHCRHVGLGAVERSICRRACMAESFAPQYHSSHDPWVLNAPESSLHQSTCLLRKIIDPCNAILALLVNCNKDVSVANNARGSPTTDLIWYAPGPGAPVLTLMSGRLADGKPSTGREAMVESTCGPMAGCRQAAISMPHCRTQR